MHQPQPPRPQNHTQDDEHHWQHDAVCQSTDPEIFFPEPRGNPIPAINICRTCPVRLPCLRAGLHEEYGVWGGLTSDDRKQLRTRMAASKRQQRNDLLDEATN